MEKLLTIIIPTYNMEKYLEKCLDSLIIGRDIEFLEILVINDGSKDNSISIAKSFQDRYPDTFRVIDKENGNYGSCINRGLKEATGKYIKILDADDFYNRESLSELIPILRKSNVDIIFNDYIVIDEIGKELYHLSFSLPQCLEFNIKDTFKKNEYSKIRMHSITYNRKIFKDINYIQTEKISYTDQEWIFLPMTKVRTALYFNKVLYYYLYGRQGQSMSEDKIVRNIAQLELIVYSLLEKYNKSIITCDSFVKEYMEKKILDQIRAVYNLYILNPRLSTKELIQFDSNIKEQSLNIYNLAEEFTINKVFHYISYIRKHEFKRKVVYTMFVINKQINIIKRFFFKSDIY